MSRIIDENFEGTGYEESWSETISTGCTLNEDSAIPGTPPAGSGSQCLNAVVLDATNNQAYATQIKTNQAISYCRFYFYISEEGLSDGNLSTISRIGSATAVAAGIQIGQNSGILQLRYLYRSSGSEQYTGWVTISLNTWYRIEWQYDITNLLWAWRIDGVTQYSGSLVAATVTPDRVQLGFINHTGATQTTVYEDLFVWADDMWIGGLSIPIAMHHYQHHIGSGV